MRARTAVFVVTVLVLAGFGVFRLVAGDRSDLGDLAGPAGGAATEEGEEGALFPTGDALYAQRAVAGGARTIAAYRTALEQAAAIRARTRRLAPELAEARWTPAGRTDVGGRVVDLAVDPSTADALFAATAGGGMWKSTDGGLTWSPSWDPQATQTMGAVAVAPDGTAFAGTGAPFPAAGFVLWGGTGLFRSRDGGATWDAVGLEDSGAVGRIAPDPTDPRRIFVAAAGSPLVPAGERGLYRSTDGGESWDLVLAPANGTTGAVDVAVDPADPANLLATTWDRDILSGRIAGPGSGVHLSTDGGSTWREVRLPGSERSTGRIGVAFAPSDPARAYAIVANDPDGQAVGLWRSTDGGRSWARTSASASALGGSSNGWWFGELWVDPADPDRVLVAGNALLESTDAGERFSANIGAAAVGSPGRGGDAMPPDHHAVVWDPRRPGRVYLGGGGGIARSLQDGRRGTWAPAVSQGWTAQYSVKLRALGGPVPAITGTAAATRPVPVEFDPSDPDVVYYGGRTLNRSEDRGATWEAISPDLTEGPGSPSDPLAVITAVAPAAADPDVIYVGTSNGLLWRTDDLGASWVRLRDRDASGDIPEAWVTRVAVDPDHPDSVYAGFSGYREQPHLIGSEDGGRTWTYLSGPLPQAPVNDVMILSDRRVVAGTDVGAFLTPDGGATWLALGADLPAVPVLDIRSERAGRVVLAATFGHGAQRVDLP